MSRRQEDFELTPHLILRAYAAGVFPMADSAEAKSVFWVDPKTRGVLPLNELHIPRSLRKRVLKGGFRVTHDQDFAGVVDGCAGRDSTWINAEIRKLFTELHELGFAHSIEVWKDDELVGGLYGVRLGSAFFGESMFSDIADASKVALVHLVARLRFGGFTLLDTQFVTEHLARLGATEISRKAYHRQLATALDRIGDFHALPDDAPAQEVLQLCSQTS
jgi:leucyl/phenylalanyl-tRNA--protein transferase